MTIEEITTEELKESFKVHKTACKAANVKPMSWKKFLLANTYFKNTKLLIKESKKLHREIMELKIENAKIDSLNPYNLNQNIAYEYSAGF